ncbi:trypsin Blo t 3-like [Anticarsia gemmatalis]|uniref:trypsin Blo t 3-like n=1 Tax=Anticarsia gemmatalis TaxID=129554 RepID=UPI003F7757AA
MDKFTVFIVLFMAFYTKDVWCKSLNETDAGDDNKIVGGTDADITTYPYQAYLVLDDGRDQYECGGSIISEFYVLTAAHCLLSVRVQTVYVRIGSTNKNSGGTQYTSTTFYTHPQYNTRTYDYDVAIIQIDEGMDLDGFYARAITLVGLGNDPQDGVNMIITGWGNTSQGGTSSEILQVAQVPVVDRATCDDQIPATVTTRMFCAGFDAGGVDTCQGDSGGPAVSTRTGRQAGITSFGYGCAQPNSPGVYTRIGNINIRTYIMMMTGV